MRFVWVTTTAFDALYPAFSVLNNGMRPSHSRPCNHFSRCVPVMRPPPLITPSTSSPASSSSPSFPSPPSLPSLPSPPSSPCAPAKARLLHLPTSIISLPDPLAPVWLVLPFILPMPFSMPLPPSSTVSSDILAPPPSTIAPPPTDAMRASGCVGGVAAVTTAAHGWGPGRPPRTRTHTPRLDPMHACQTTAPPSTRRPRCTADGRLPSALPFTDTCRSL
jgi:hypothetical protein